MSEEDKMLHVLGVVLIQQFSPKAGIKRFDKEGKAAAKKELTQHHEMQTYLHLYPKTLNTEQRDEDLASLMFLVEKLYGRIKAISCSYGRKQRITPCYKKEDSASLTVSNEGEMITCDIEAHKEIHVACIYIYGAYLHAVIDEEKIILLRVPLAELMVMVDPKL